MPMVSINTLGGVAWLVGALVWLRRAIADKARPTTRAPSFSQLEPQTETNRRFGMWFCFVLYTIVGVLFFLRGYLSHGH